MSASVGGDSNQDVELNLAPIIDCFTVLITYLLVTASFITLAALDVGVSATGTGAPAPADAGPPPMVMTMELKTDGSIAIQIRGGVDNKQITMTLPAGPGASGWSTSELESKLLEIQKTWPTLNEVSVSAEPTVLYKSVISVIHEIQNVMPKVYISS